MKNNTATLNKPSKVAFQIEQALIGMELKKANTSLLKYVGFFCSQFPVKRLLFMHVLQEQLKENRYFAPSWEVLVESDSIDKATINARQELLGFKLDKNPKVEYAAAEGNVLEELINKSKPTKTDLIVVGRKEADEYTKILAKNLSRQSNANVLMVPENSKTKLKKILVPIDFSENSVEALKTAVKMCKQMEKPAKIICLHVYNMPSFADFRTSKNFKNFKKVVEENHLDGFEAFLHTNARKYKDNIEVVLIERERPGYSFYIYDYATNNKVDLIVLGRRGHAPARLMFMGSVAESLIDRNTTIPTLIVK